MDNFIDIGCGVSIAFAEYQGQVVGLHERHPNRKDPSQPCCGFVWFDFPDRVPVARVPGLESRVHGSPDAIPIHSMSRVRQTWVYPSGEVGPGLVVDVGQKLTSVLIHKLGCLDLIADSNVVEVQVH